MKYKNILLVNDDADNAEFFLSAVNAVDPKIRSSVEYSALDALKKLQDSKLSPDVIFLDYQMPYLDGSEFIKLLRDIKKLKNVPVILCSRRSCLMLKDAVTKFSKVQFLKKKRSFRKLFEVVQKLIIS